MNEQNFDYLKNQMKFTGFGEDLHGELYEQLMKGASEFTLTHLTMFGHDHSEAILQFRKSDSSELYFFNRYQLQLKNENGEVPVTQTFRVGKDNNITLKEAYNLMSGRSVYKELTPREGDKYHAWLLMNFKETDPNGEYRIRQIHQNYGYDLPTTLALYPIKELDTAEDKKRLLRSLERGNRQMVYMRLNGLEEKFYVEASPQFKSLNIYDHQSRLLIGESHARLQRAKEEPLVLGEQEESLKKNTKRNGL